LSAKTSKILNKASKTQREKEKRMKEKEGVIRIIGNWDDKTFEEFKVRMKEFLDWEAERRKRVEILEKEIARKI
jgi:hypothetical protein